MSRADLNQPTSDLDPRRPPDWRFRAASRAVADGRVLLPWQADAATLALASYLSLEGICRHEAERARLALRRPSVAAVLEVAREPDRRTAAAIEGLLLAREKLEQIARTVNVHVDTVAAYEFLFFDVSDRLDATEFIMTVIADKLRPRAFETVADVHGVAQLIGYLCGPEVLQDYLACAPRDFKTLWRTPTELLVTLRTRLQLQIACRLAARGGSLDRRDGSEMLKILNGIIDERTAQAEPSYSRSPGEKQVRDMLRGGSGPSQPR